VLKLYQFLLKHFFFQKDKANQLGSNYMPCKVKNKNDGCKQGFFFLAKQPHSCLILTIECNEVR